MRTGWRGMVATVCCLPREKNRSSRQGRDGKKRGRPATTKKAGLKPGLYTNEYIMALENCTLCRGTGWKLVPRGDGVAGKGAVGRHFGMGKRAAPWLGRAKKPNPYPHLPFHIFPSPPPPCQTLYTH